MRQQLNHNDLNLINSVIEASLDEAEKRGVSLTGAISRLFALVDGGERDFHVLKAAALDRQAG